MPYGWKCWYHFIHHSDLFLKLLIRAPNPKPSSSSKEESNTIECALVLDLVPYWWLLWGVFLSGTFLARLISRVVSGAWLDELASPCDVWRSCNFCQFTIDIGPLPLSGLLVYRVLVLNSMTNSSFLKLSWILFWPPGWSQIIPNYQLVYWELYLLPRRLIFPHYFLSFSIHTCLLQGWVHAVDWPMCSCFAKSCHYNWPAWAMYCKWLVLCAPTSAHKAGNWWFYLALHCTWIIEMVNVEASCCSALLVVTWPGQLMHGSTFHM